MKKLVPNVQEIKYLDKEKYGVLDLGSCQTTDYTCFFDERLETLSEILVDTYPSTKRNGLITFKNQKLKEEEYILEIKKKRIVIKASTVNGCYYALITLKHLAQIYNGLIPALIIHDYPDMKVRGMMLDISRSKVPSVKTIFEYIDLLSDFKYNHLELYVEGFSFEYKSMPFVNKDNNHITVSEYQEIEKYANDHFIDLVPNQNGFGHMADWLKLDEFKSLGNVEGLFHIWGSNRYCSTLDPTNPESFELVKKMYHDMLPYANSKYFNMNFDEPYELGYGKSKALCDEIGKEKVYTNFYNKLADVVKSYGKTPMLWGDVIINHPEAINDVDPNAILIDWGYSDDYPFLKTAKMLNKLKRPYILAPGASGWAMGTGKYLEMLGSVKHAAEACYNNNGLGLLYTDWGDFGHLQYPIYALPGIIYTALLCWNYKKTSEHQIKDVLTDLLEDDTLAQMVIDLQLYNQQEEVYRGYSSKLFNPIIQAELCATESDELGVFKTRMINQLLTPKEVNNYHTYFQYLELKLQSVADVASDKLIYQEMDNSILLLKTLLDANTILKGLFNHEVNEEAFNKMMENFKKYLANHYMLWHLRNKEDGYSSSAKRIERFQDVLKKLKKEAINYE